MTIGTRLFTWLKGVRVGEDSFGNRYFRERRTPAGRRQRRWVLYAGDVEAFSIDPENRAFFPNGAHGRRQYSRKKPPVNDGKS